MSSLLLPESTELPAVLRIRLASTIYSLPERLAPNNRLFPFGLLCHLYFEMPLRLPVHGAVDSDEMPTQDAFTRFHR